MLKLILSYYTTITTYRSKQYIATQQIKTNQNNHTYSKDNCRYQIPKNILHSNHKTITPAPPKIIYFKKQSLPNQTKLKYYECNTTYNQKFGYVKLWFNCYVVFFFESAYIYIIKRQAQVVQVAILLQPKAAYKLKKHSSNREEAEK